MKIAIFCERSGMMREAFRAKGHEVWSFDLQPSLDDSPYHVIGDCRPYVDARWDMAICHPVCKYLALSGVRWLHSDPDRWLKLYYEAIPFFELFLHAPIPRIVIENPIQHGYTFGRIPRYSQIIHPWQFGHPERKPTCLWVKGLPAIKPTNNVYDYMMTLPKRERERIHHMPPGPDRENQRSQTYSGIATAFAEQLT